MTINSLSKNTNAITMLTYYLPVYSLQGKCKINSKKYPRKVRLLNAGKTYF